MTIAWAAIYYRTYVGMFSSPACIATYQSEPTNDLTAIIINTSPGSCTVLDR